MSGYEIVVGGVYEHVDGTPTVVDVIGDVTGVIRVTRGGVGTLFSSESEFRARHTRRYYQPASPYRSPAEHDGGVDEAVRRGSETPPLKQFCVVFVWTDEDGDPRMQATMQWAEDRFAAVGPAAEKIGVVGGYRHRVVGKDDFR